MSNLFFFLFQEISIKEINTQMGPLFPQTQIYFPPKMKMFFSPELALSSHLTGKEIQEEITEP